ncbi:hypothetical protein Tco_1402789 [Tanacetum coccineum]
MAELQRQKGPAKGPAQPELPEEAGVTTALATRDANTNGVDSHNSGTGARRNERATHECTYPEFMKCQPLNFKGTEGLVELTQWIKKMETTELKKKMTDKYGPRTEIKKFEVELWELKVKESDKIEKYVGGLLETDIHKRTKNKAKDDKTKHGMEKCVKTKPNRSQKSIKSKSQQKSQTVKVKVNPDKVKVKKKSKSEEI